MPHKMDEWLELPDLVEKVQELLEMGLYDEAQELLDRFYGMYQQDWEVHFLFSRIYLEQNKPRLAIPYLHKSLKLDNNNPDVLLGLFYCLSQMHQLKKAGKYLELAAEFHPDNDAVICAQIWYYTEILKFTEATAIFERALSLGTDNPETFRNAGVMYERTGQRENAETCFRTALQLNPQFDEVRDLLADHYIFIGEIDKSINLYREHLVISPNNIRSLSRLVFCLSQKEQVQEALALAEEITRLYPNSPVGYVDLAYVALNSGNIDKAFGHAQQALDISPLDAEALRVMAIACSEKKDNEGATTAFDQALSIEPENTEILRDYYHHLRAMDKTALMEKLVHTVIKIEQPYCIEDYWFLADFYREKGENLKAFHYLNKAYKSMPGEKELIPPMVDIMLDEGHIKPSLPFLMHYVETNGWNDIMNQFSRNKRLKTSWIKDYVLFLRFSGQNPSEFRAYIFVSYFQKFALISLCVLTPLFSLLFFLLAGVGGLILPAITSLALIAGWKGWTFYMNKKLRAGENRGKD